MNDGMKNDQIQTCPQCDNHCPADALRCGRGRRYFGAADGDGHRHDHDCAHHHGHGGPGHHHDHGCAHHHGHGGRHGHHPDEGRGK